MNDGAGGYRVGGYREVRVPPALAPFAEVGWSYVAGGGVGPDPGRPELVIPETGVSLCVVIRRDVRGDVDTARLVVMGPIREPRTVRPSQGLEMAGVRLRAEWCRPLLDVDATEHDDAMDEPPPRLARPWAGLVDRLATAASPDCAVATLADALVDRADRLLRQGAAARPFGLAHTLLDAVRSDPAAPLALDDRARSMGISARHLRRLVREATGRGPKYFQRVRRLQLAVSLAEAGRAPSWSAVAARAGYADQPHLNLECRALTGRTPVELHAARVGGVRFLQDAPAPGA